MSARRLLGLLFLVIAALGAVAYTLIQNGTLASFQYDLSALGLRPRYEPVALRGYVSGDTAGLLDDPEVRAFLKNHYNMTLAVFKAGSIEMVQRNTDNVDFLWPSSQIALEIYKAQNRPLAGEEIVLGSPLVLYSWDVVVDGLEASGIAKKVDDSYYTVDLAALTAAMLEGKQWSDFGATRLHGPVRVISASPATSGGGTQFAGLLANTLNNGQVADAATIGDYLPQIDSYFASLGFLQRSSADLFAQYIRQGPGAYPMIVGYENQVVEYGLKNKQYLSTIKDRVRILYPQPTIWSSHPLIAINDQARRLADALTDPELQRIAWAKHGFRTGVAGSWNDAAVAQITGVAATVDSVTAMPSSAVMERIIKELSQ